MQCGFGSVFGSEQTIGLFSIRSIDNFFFVVARYKLQPELFSFLQIENASPSTGLHLEPRIRCRTPQCEPKRTTPFFYPLRPPFPFRSMQATFPLCLTFPDDALPPRIFWFTAFDIPTLDCRLFCEFETTPAHFPSSTSHRHVVMLTWESPLQFVNSLYTRNFVFSKITHLVELSMISLCNLFGSSPLIGCKEGESKDVANEVSTVCMGHYIRPLMQQWSKTKKLHFHL